MGTLQFKNNASTELSGSINDSQATITVLSSAAFPVLTGDNYFYATMYEVSAGTEINIEIIKVTATVGSTWTIVRGQEGTTARARNGITTCYIENRLTAAAAQLMAQRDNNLGDLTNIPTARTNLGLGSMATQSASAVAITGGSISGVTFDALDSSSTISDNVDPTKKLAFQISGLTTGVTRTLTVPDASGTIALTSDLSAGYQPLDSDLTALAALSANGTVVRTATGTFEVRALTQPAAGITVTNGDGVSGNPTLGLANDLAAVEGLATTGFVRRTGADTWSASAIVDGDLPSALAGKTINSSSIGVTIPAAGKFTTLETTSNATVAGNLTFDGLLRRIIGDFSNVTGSNRTAFQTSVANDGSTINALPNGSGNFANFAIFDSSDADNAGYGYLGINGTDVRINVNKTGTGTIKPFSIYTNSTKRLQVNADGGVDFSTGLREVKVAIGASDIDVRAGNLFTKTISGTTTLTVSNVPTTGTAASFMLDMTNGGSATVNWWSGVKWASGTAPTLTSSGRDVLGFFTHDGGTTWTGLLLGKDVK